MSNNQLEDFSDKARTPSPGRDYASLLNESVRNKWHQDVYEEEDYTEKYSQLTTNRDTEVKVTLRSLENEVHKMGKELSKLRAEKNYWQAQCEIVKKEKEMHIEKHAKERNLWEKETSELADKLNQERKNYKDECITITKQLQEMQQNYKELKSKKDQQAENFKRKLEENEKIYVHHLRERDSEIFSLKLQNSQTRKPTSPVMSPKYDERPRIIPKEKQKKILKKTSKIGSPKSSFSSDNEKRKHLNEISHMIVMLEKEQAELRQKVRELEFSAAFERDKKKIADLIRRNEDRLNEAKTIQEDMVKDNFLVSNVLYR